MAITVRVNNTTGTTVAVRSQDNYRVRTIGIAPSHILRSANNLVELADVDGSDVDHNETLVFDESTQKFVVKELPVLKGGTF